MGQMRVPVELTRVLHVPQLRNNLLSCLYLTKRKGIIMEVDASKIRFKRDGTTLFTATVTPTPHRVLWMLQLSSIQSLLMQLQLFQWTSTFGIVVARTTVTLQSRH